MAAAFMTRLNLLASSNLKGRNLYKNCKSILTDLSNLKSDVTIDFLREQSYPLTIILQKINDVINLNRCLKRMFVKMNNEPFNAACDRNPIEKCFAAWFSEVFKFFYSINKSIQSTFDSVNRFFIFTFQKILIHLF